MPDTVLSADIIEDRMVHEFGHVLNLDHDDDHLNVMRTSTPYPLVGGSGTHAEPYPTDAHGVRNLYGIGSQTNAFSSAQWLFLGDVVATGQPYCYTISRCRGDSVQIKYTAANNGSTNLNGMGFRIYLNNSPTGYFGGWTVMSGSANIAPNTHFTESRYITIPPTLPNGVYWIFWQLDAGGTWTETIETDNYVHSCTTVNVTC